MSSEPERNRLPFEPGKKRKKPTKNSPTLTKEDQTSPVTRAEMAIPPAVSRRMGLRMAFFSGIPTALGMCTFIASYIIISNKWLELPNIAVVLTSMGFFGLGVLGLSYGVISTSWDEEISGTKLGWNEFTTNFGRLRTAWKSKQDLKTED